METVLIIVHLMIVAALIGTVLLQRSEGGALGMGGGGGGGGGFMTGRGTANALTRATTFLAAGFFATSLTLAILANQGTTTVSPFDGIESSDQGGEGGVLDALRTIQGDAPVSDAPQVPTSQ